MRIPRSTRVLSLALLAAAAAFPQSGKPPQASAQLRTIKQVELAQGPALSAFADHQGQMFGAGANTVVQFDEAGKSVRSFATTIARPSIAAHGPGGLLVADLGAKSLHTLDLKTGALSPLLKLGDVQDSSTEVPGGHLLRDGALASVASDGKQVFVGVQAGFSSAVFRIDPVARRVVGRSWAGTSDAQAMAWHGGILYQLSGKGTEVRRFNDQLQRSQEVQVLPGGGALGIGVRAGELLTLAKGQVQKLALSPNDQSPQALSRTLDRLLPVPFKARPWIWPINLAKKVAVLICGDLAQNFAGECFWNDTVWMYKTLLANGYREQDIFVLYGDGADYASANPKYTHPTRVTDFAATIPNVNMIFDGLKNGDAARGIPKLDSNDTLFVWTFDHGGRSGTTSTLCLRDGSMLATSFAAKANAVTYGKRAFFMQQCFSGGFIDPLKNAKTYISTASSATETAHPADTENESYGGRSYSHGEYNYYITCALNRLAPSGAAVNADANADAWISMAEMHAWYVSHENRSETPQANDMGGIGGTFRLKK